MTTAEMSEWHDPIATGRLPSFEELTGSDASTIVMRDSQLQERGQRARAQLRSIPLLQTFGLDSVVHTDVWADQFKLVDHDHIASDDVEDPAELSFPLVHIVTQQGITDYGEEELVRKLLRRSIDEHKRYILVTDTAAPKTPTFTQKPGKSVVDEFGAPSVQDYEHLSSLFVDNYLDSKIPIVDTRNVFFHAASTIHDEEGAPAQSIDDIFDFTNAPPPSPIWEAARYFLQYDLESVLDAYTDRLREALRSWTERGDTQRAANNILEVMQVCDYDIKQLEDYRTTDPEYR